MDVASTLLATSLLMVVAVPNLSEPPYSEGVYELHFDPSERV